MQLRARLMRRIHPSSSLPRFQPQLGLARSPLLVYANGFHFHNSGFSVQERPSSCNRRTVHITHYLVSTPAMAAYQRQQHHQPSERLGGAAFNHSQSSSSEAQYDDLRNRARQEHSRMTSCFDRVRYSPLTSASSGGVHADLVL